MENMKKVASKIAPNPKECNQWIDLSADPNGSVVKFWNGKEWISTDIDTIISSIEIVSELPSSPSSTTLYLIPE